MHTKNLYLLHVSLVHNDAGVERVVSVARKKYFFMSQNNSVPDVKLFDNLIGGRLAIMLVMQHWNRS